MRIHERLAIALAAWLIILIAAGTLIWQKYRNDHEQTAVRNLEVTDEYISSLYREASRIFSHLHARSGERCSPQVLAELNMLAAISPHVRGVAIVQNGTQTCSSLEGEQAIEVHESTGKVNEYQTVKKIKNGFVYYDIVFPTKSGAVIVSITGYFVKEAMQRMFPGAEFYTWQDYSRFGPHGRAHINEQYPYVIVWYNTSSVYKMLKSNRELIYFMAVISLMAAFGIYQWTGLSESTSESIKRGLRKKQFYPVYQPVIDSKHNVIKGLEVLMRWKTSDGYEMSPAKFIAIAEEKHLLEALSENQLKTVMQQMAHFRHMGLYLAINVSPALLLSDRYVSILMGFRYKCFINGIELLAEITERESFEGKEGVLTAISRLRAAGVKIAMDDFGTGFSNISSINKICPDFLKADREFIGACQSGGLQEILLKSIIKISQDASIPLIAEGVETQAQLEYLERQGLRFFQGYYFCRPAPLQEAKNFIDNYSNRAR
jgi:c-di-GMP phosphodiesterase